MKTYRVVWENGKFHPTEPVHLPEHWEGAVAVPEELQCREEPLDQLYDLLSARFDTGDRDAAERHNEHQP